MTQLRTPRDTRRDRTGALIVAQAVTSSLGLAACGDSSSRKPAAPTSHVGHGIPPTTRRRGTRSQRPPAVRSWRRRGAASGPGTCWWCAPDSWVATGRRARRAGLDEPEPAGRRSRRGGGGSVPLGRARLGGHEPGRGEDVFVENVGGIARITLNRPVAVNALPSSARGEITLVLRDVEPPIASDTSRYPDRAVRRARPADGRRAGHRLPAAHTN